MKKLTVNYHTHTARCHHAGGTDREYVEAAIKNGFETIGFSDHTPMFYEGDYKSGSKMALEEAAGYFESIEQLKHEYKNDIKIYSGLEFEYYPSVFGKITAFLSQFPVDYLALGQHYIWEEKSQNCSFNHTSDPERLASFYDCVREAVATGKFMFICHPDVVHFKGSDEDYERLTVPFLRDMLKADISLEINVKGIEEAEKTYPEPLFWKLAGQVGNKAIIGLDAHEPWVFSDEECINKAYELAEKYGVNLLSNPSFPVQEGYELKL